MIVVIEPSTQKFLTHFLILIRSGSLTDPDDRQGLATFTARALLRGTVKKSFHEWSEAVEILGGSISVNVDQSEMMIRASVLTANLEPFLDLIQEILTEPSFEESEIEQLRKILQGELEQNLQDPRTLVSRALLQKAYWGTRAARSPEGTFSGLESITREDLLTAFKRSFASAGIIFGVTSVVSETQLRASIESRFKALAKSPSQALEFPRPSFQERKQRQAVIVDREEMSTVPMFIATPGVSDSDPEMMALEVGNFIFGDDFTARLMQTLRNQNGWTYGAYSGFTQAIGPKPQAGLFSIYLFPSAEFIEKAAPKALGLLQAYVEKGLTDQEFQFAKEALFSRYPFRLDTPEKRLTLRIREFATGRPFLSVEAYREQLSCLERTKVNDTIRKRTSTESLIVAAAGDAKVLKPVLSKLEGMTSVEEIEVLA